jgi:hypothetical protein
VVDGADVVVLVVSVDTIHCFNLLCLCFSLFLYLL